MNLKVSDIRTIVRKIPVELRNAARKERAIIHKEMVQDPISASFKLSHGQYNFENNLKLQKEVAKLLDAKASTTYAETNQFFQRQPIGSNLNIVEKEAEFIQRQPEIF